MDEDEQGSPDEADTEPNVYTSPVLQGYWQFKDMPFCDIRRCLDKLSPKTVTTPTGFLTEATIFRALQSASVVRCFEYHAFDGMICANHRLLEACDTQSESTWMDRLLWAYSETEQGFWVPFDIKTRRLAFDKKSNGFYFTSLGHPKKQKQGEFAIIHIASVDKQFGVVPWTEWEVQTERRRYMPGDINAICHCPPWMAPFMVNTDDLVTAIERIAKAAVDSSIPYQNPTTRVKMHGWEPRGLQSVEHEIHSSFQEFARKKIVSFLEALREHGIECEMNPVAPLVCDYLIRFKKVSESWLRIEDKRVVGARMSSDNTQLITNFNDDAPRSPFHLARQWHFLMLEGADGIAFFLPWSISDLRKRSSSTGVCLKGATFLHKDVEDFRLSFSREPRVWTKEIKAILEAYTAVVLSRPAILDKEMASSLSNSVELETDRDESEQVDDPDNSGKKRIEYVHNKHLWWLCSPFNRICSQVDGHSMVLLPLDPGHPYGNMIAIRFIWAEHHRRELFESGRAPSLSSAELVDQECVILNVEDLALPHSSAHASCAAYARQGSYLLYRRSHQPCILIGGLVNAHDSQRMQSPPAQLFLPSEWLKPVDLVTEEHNGRKVIEVAREKPYSNYFPLRDYMLDFVEPTLLAVNFEESPSLFENLFRFLYKKSSIGVRATSGEYGSFKPREYRLKVHEVLQAQWDRGVLWQNTKRNKKKKRETQTEE